MDFAKRSRPPMHEPYADDARIINELRDEDLTKLGPEATTRQRNVVFNMVSSRRRFSAWLQSEQRGSIVSRLTGTDQQQRSLDEDYRDFTASEGKLVGMGFDRLRQFLGAEPQSKKHPYPDDARIIDGLEKEDLSKLKPEETRQRKVIQGLASNRRKFSDWLQREQRGSIVSRLTGTAQQQRSLNDDYTDFKAAHGKVGVGFDRLRQFLGAESQSKKHLYPDDARIIDGLEKTELSMLKPEETRQRKKAIQNQAGNRRRFSGWLQTEQRGSIVSRITGTDQQQQSLKDDYTDFAAAHGKVSVGFDRLRHYVWVVKANAALGVSPKQAGGEPRPGESSSAWSPHLPSDFEWPTPEGAPARSSEIYRGLGSFVDLPSTPQETRDDAQSAPVGRPAARPPLFTGPSDAPARSSEIYRGLDSFVDLPSTPREMRDDAQSVPVGRAAARPPLFTGPSDAPARSSEIYRGLDSFVDLPSTPQETRDDAQSAPVGRAAGRPPLFTGESDAPARSSEIYRGLDSFVDLPATPHEMRDDAHSAPVLSPAGSAAFFVGPSGVLQELEDIGYLVPEDWQHGSQPVADVQLRILNNHGLLPTQFSGPRQVLINGETYSIALGPRGRGAQFIHHPRPAPVPRAQIGSLTGASSVDRSGRVLGPTQWLGDEHIERDYGVLRRELQESNPDLAARMRFVDPLIAQMLRSGSNEDAERAFGWIRGDTADFLFLPVSDASAADRGWRGSHWSLLLVDRRDRARPVAYHYDSAPGPNNLPAEQLAERLQANLQQGSMREQSNTYDCGVFVVDGTRELVRRLAEGWHPDPLNLSNLRINRRALQDRLSAGVGFN
ncbi:hypothetical protein I6F35_18370 [Bradyrhizobium sp. BRP22]|uniref:Ulp1 family isopeptidase n=1 Tax=Bradyrhizobium sp. BRP22 TaxID=2793821 RepID=UPI001CD2D962|nr:Ulp1 family isopeptidase [Bradyrhizobium sp. BRP22]MCA1455172.1 hypothetical protein [Bradyrhizobium sp. BRP22]